MDFKNRKNNVFLLIAVLWFFINLMLLKFALDKMPLGNRLLTFYPFNYKSNAGIWAYDITEFISYTFVFPFLFYFLLLKQPKEASGKSVSKYALFFIIYCLAFAAISFLDNSSIVYFFISLFKASLIFLLSMYFAGSIIDKLMNKH